MKRLLILSLFAALLFASCEDNKNDDVVKQPSREGAVATTLSVEHKGTYDVLTITDTVWIRNAVDKVIITKDTLKPLGSMQVESDEDDDGNTTKVTVPKNYELYITVK